MCIRDSIAAGIDRDVSVISREVARNSTKTRGYRMVTAGVAAQRRGSRPQPRKVAVVPALRARVLADLKHSRTPRQIAGRLHLEAREATVGLMKGSPPAEGHTASHEAIYQFIYAMPRGDPARHGIFLRRKQTRRRPRKGAGQRGAPIVGMISIDERDPAVADRRVPGHWESQCGCQAAWGGRAGGWRAKQRPSRSSAHSTSHRRRDRAMRACL